MPKEIGPREAGLRAMREANMARNVKKPAQIEQIKKAVAVAATKRGKLRKKK